MQRAGDRRERCVEEAGYKMLHVVSGKPIQAEVEKVAETVREELDEATLGYIMCTIVHTSFMHIHSLSIIVPLGYTILRHRN